MNNKWVKAFIIAGWLEAASFLILLLIAMPMKYIMGEPALVKLMGSIHGGLFILYIVLASVVGDKLNWMPKIRFYSYLAAVFPMGPIWFDKKYLNTAKV